MPQTLSDAAVDATKKQIAQSVVLTLVQVFAAFNVYDLPISSISGRNISRQSLERLEW